MFALSLKTYCKYYGHHFEKYEDKNNYFYNMSQLGCVISAHKLLSNGKDGKLSLQEPTELTTDLIKIAVDNIKTVIEKELCNQPIYKVSRTKIADIKNIDNTSFYKCNLVTTNLTLDDFVIELYYQGNILAFNIHCPKLINVSCGFRITMINKDDLSPIELLINDIKTADFFKKEKIQAIVKSENEKSIGVLKETHETLKQILASFDNNVENLIKELESVNN